MNPATLFGIGIAALGGLLLIAFRRPLGLKGSSGRTLLIMPDRSVFPDYNAFADQLARAERELGVSATHVRSPSEIIGTLHAAAPISRLVFMGHGTTTQFIRPGAWGIRVGADSSQWLSHETLGRALRATLAPGAVVSFAGCRSGASPGEDNWGPLSYQSGGAASLVGRLRDAAGGVDAEFRGKAAAGTAIANPTGRAFSGREIGGPGRAISSSASTHSPDAIIRWTLGGSL